MAENEVQGTRDPFTLRADAKELLLELQELLADRGSLSWSVGCELLADLQVAVTGDFAAAEEILENMESKLPAASAWRLEMAAVRCSYAATRVACYGGDLGDSMQEVTKCLELVSPGSKALQPLQRYLDELGKATNIYIRLYKSNRDVEPGPNLRCMARRSL